MVAVLNWIISNLIAYFHWMDWLFVTGKIWIGVGVAGVLLGIISFSISGDDGEGPFAFLLGVVLVIVATVGYF